jgi:cytochrome c oxidase subunit 2
MTHVRSARWRRVAYGSAGLATLVLAGCAKDSPQDTWKPAGESAQKIDDLQRPVFAIAGVIGLIVVAAVAFAVVRFRDRGQPIPEQSHGKPALEIGLTILPALILAGVGTFTVKTVFELAKTSDCAMEVNVTGQQWWWEYDYPVTPANEAKGITKPIQTSGQIVIPTGECVLMRITSRDVIHSFWIPKLNGKKDAVPGRIHDLRMQADEPGIYSGQCTEFCGLSHANMRMQLVALSPADFDTWVNQQLTPAEAPAADTPAAEGEAVFVAQCSRCHQVDGLVDADGNPIVSRADENVVSGAAPNLTHLLSRTTFAGGAFELVNQACEDALADATSEEIGAMYLAGVSEDCLNRIELEEWLRNAPAKKPMYADPAKAGPDGKVRGMPYLALSEADIDKLVEYLLTLK